MSRLGELRHGIGEILGFAAAAIGAGRRSPRGPLARAVGEPPFQAGGFAGIRDGPMKRRRRFLSRKV